MTALLTGVHHVQLAMPKGCENDARAFYVEALGLTEIEKPAALKPRGGVWFQSGVVHVHLGVEDPFVPARKAHPAFIVLNLARAITQLENVKAPVSEQDALPGFARVFTEDPFGNRIELVESPS